MMESVPFYVIAVFVLTTLLTIWLFLQSFNKTATRGVSRNVLTFLIPFWLVLTAFMAMSGVYQQSGSLPPRVVTLANQVTAASCTSGSRFDVRLRYKRPGAASDSFELSVDFQLDPGFTIQIGRAHV